MHKPKIQIGREDMSRSAHTFLPKNKLVAGMGIGAIAMLAMAGPALSRRKQVRKKTKCSRSRPSIQVPGLPEHWPARSFRLTSAGSIQCSTSTSWLTATTRRSTSSIRATFSRASHNSSTRGSRASLGDNDTSGPDGVLTANNHTELWVGDSPGQGSGSMNARPGQVWVLNTWAREHRRTRSWWGNRTRSRSAGQPEPTNSVMIRRIT